MSRKDTPITDALAVYIRQTTVREPEALRRLRESSEDHPHASMQISPEQGQFLHLMARVTGARKALEVGVFLGYSSSWVALALPPGGKLIACDVNEEYAAAARRTWREAGVDNRTELRLGPALETLDALLAEGQAGAFDFAFIDADKANYSNYYERALQLLRPGGLIAVDNVLWDGSVADTDDHEPETEAIRSFNRMLRADARVSSTLATIGDGLALACKL
jgi:predicted O-methyltransferase YrrM